MPDPKILVRPPPPSFCNAISPHPEKDTIDYNLALKQHEEFVCALQQAGAEVEALPPLADFPDSGFIEDNALVLEGRIFLCSMKAESRRGEPAHLLPRLQQTADVEKIEPPVFIDGGDVIETETTVYIGQSHRTGPEAINFFKTRLKKSVVPVTVSGILHLKTGASYLGDGTFLVNPAGCDWKQFEARDCLKVMPSEAYAANSLTVGRNVLLPAGFEDTKNKVENAGYRVLPVPMSEFEKADGGLTCLHLKLTTTT